MQRPTLTGAAGLRACVRRARGAAGRGSPRLCSVPTTAEGGEHHREMAAARARATRLVRQVVRPSAAVSAALRAAPRRAEAELRLPRARGFATDAGGSDKQEAHWVETESGLKWRDVVVGDGPETVPGEFVKVRYRGALADGTVFDENLDSGRPLHYRHDRGFVVWGFDEGVCGMRAGGERQLVIPPHLGYGFKRVGPIPPNSELHFTIRVENVAEGAEPVQAGWLDGFRRLFGSA